MISYELTVKVEISEDFGKYQEIEKNILAASRLAASDLMKQIFLDYEKRFVVKHTVQKKDCRPKSYKTLLGDINLERWRVWDVFSKSYIYPVDRWMGLYGRQRVSAGLMEEMVNQAVHLPYGKAAILASL
jgi:sensor histidine kinase YesM